MLKLKLFVAAVAASVMAFRHRLRLTSPGSFALANVLLMPGSGDTKLADEVIASYHLVKLGSDADHIALCDAADLPLGFTRDDAATEAGRRVAVELFGLGHRGTLGTASGAITAGHLVCPGANGVLRDVTLLSSTTVYVCGQAVSSAADGGTFAFVPYPPTKLVIA